LNSDNPVITDNEVVPDGRERAQLCHGCPPVNTDARCRLTGVAPIWPNAATIEMDSAAVIGMITSNAAKDGDYANLCLIVQWFQAASAKDCLANPRHSEIAGPNATRVLAFRSVGIFPSQEA
jgi:hypothetical protein